MAITRFLNIPLHGSNEIVYSTPILKNHEVLHLVKLPPSGMNKQAYVMLLNQFESGRKNHLFHYEKFLCENGFEFIWNDQGVLGIFFFLSESKE